MPAPIARSDEKRGIAGSATAPGSAGLGHHNEVELAVLVAATSAWPRGDPRHSADAAGAGGDRPDRRGTVEQGDRSAFAHFDAHREEPRAQHLWRSSRSTRGCSSRRGCTGKAVWAYAYQIVPPQTQDRLDAIKALLDQAHEDARSAARTWRSRRPEEGCLPSSRVVPVGEGHPPLAQEV